MKHVCLHIADYSDLTEVMIWCRENGFPAVVCANPHPTILTRLVMSSKLATEQRLGTRSFTNPVFYTKTQRRLCIREDDYPMVVLRFPWVKDYEARLLGYG